MTPKCQRATSAIALLLVFSLSQLYVHANLPSKSPAAKTEAATIARTGKLITRGSNPISLNGNRTHSGTTVLSGAELQTPAGVEASVQLGRNGLLRLASETRLTLNFDDSSIDVALSSGHATLTIDEGIRGSITTPDGKTTRNDATKLSTIESPAASTVDGGDTALFAAAVSPVQSSAALRACLRAAEEAYRRALREARENYARAKREADTEYRAAMRAATSDAQRQAARAAQRDAVRKARDEQRAANMAARDDRMEATRACRNPTTQTTPTDPLPGTGLDNGVGVLGGISNSAARKFGLAMLGGAIASSLIIINLDDKDPLLGINPSPSAP